MKTVFITGASKGIGLATALEYANNDYNVIATMRNVNDAEELKKFDNVLVVIPYSSWTTLVI